MTRFSYTLDLDREIYVVLDGGLPTEHRFSWERDARQKAQDMERAEGPSYPYPMPEHAFDCVCIKCARKVQAENNRLRAALIRIADNTVIDPIHREYEAVKRLQRIATNALNQEESRGA